MNKVKKIAVATGTRADWGLLFPLVREISDRGVSPIIIATYAHLFPEMGDTIQELVDDGFPPAMSVPARHAPHEAIADTTTGFTKALSFLKPDILVILGDRFEMLGVAAAAMLQRIPVAHIAGGTISEGAIDDAIRNSISQMASFHFPETDKGRSRLVLMGAKPENVVTAGALGVFNTLTVPHMTKEDIETYLDFELGDTFILGTFHPATLSDLSPVEQMKIWIEGLRIALDSQPDLKLLLTFPNTDSDPTALLSQLFTFEANNRDRVKVVASLGRVRYINAARLSSVVAGNSSSGIVEIPSLGVPVVNVGIRQQGRQCSKVVIHTALEAQAISQAISEALKKESKERARTTSNPYFKEDTPSIIAEKLINS